MPLNNAPIIITAVCKNVVKKKMKLKWLWGRFDRNEFPYRYLSAINSIHVRDDFPRVI